jgi:hypothetical protein
MSKDIPEWEFWDWRSIVDVFLLLIPFVIIGWVVLKAPDTIMRYKEKRYDKIAIASVASVKKNIELSENLDGNHVYLNMVTVDYKFSVDNEIYSGSEIIPYKTISEKRLLNRLLNNWNDTISIKYLSKDPTKSLIIIGED